MRTSILVVAAGLLGGIGCSDTIRVPTAPGGTGELEFRWEGAEVCDGDVARVVVRVPQRTLIGDGTVFYPGEATVELILNEAALVLEGLNRIRIEGSEVLLGASLAADEIEVFAGLGGGCDWIVARRV